jgi:hypothetical protein
MDQQTKTYTGGCHCGAVRYEVDAKIESVISCNCSICSKKGTLLTFVGADQFRLLSGEERLTDYRFNTRRIHHLFCSACGVESFGKGVRPDGQEMRVINVRCLDGVEPSQFVVREHDGRSS